MPPVAGGAAAAQQTLRFKTFYAAMEQLAMKSVAKLDLENPEQDFERWSLELIELAKRTGHGALAALQLDVGVEVPPPPVEGDVIVYSEQPPGFEEPGPNGEPACEMVVRWDSALYGFVPSCYEWGEEFHDFIVAYGFVACCSDRKVFILHRDGDVLIVTLHVDDLLMACSGGPRPMVT